MGLPGPLIRESLGSFPGIEHRLEFFHEKEGIRFYNDSTATIPEAAAAAIEAFTDSTIPAESGTRLILVTGGTDKNLNFNPLVQKANAATEIILLSGTGSDKLIPLLKEKDISFHGPFNIIEDAARTALELAYNARKKAAKTDPTSEPKVVVVLSPGSTSFGMFKNEFDRGYQWKETIRRL